MTGIFISYRRLESKLQARILFERLEPQFRGWVFMDTDGLKPGENFHDKIGAQLERCTVLPVLIERAHMPTEQDLPEDLRPMLDRHAFVLNLDQGFDQGMRDLVEAIRPDMGRGVSVPDWVKWVVPVAGLVARGGYLAMNPLKWLESAPKPATVAAPAPLPVPFPAEKTFRRIPAF